VGIEPPGGLDAVLVDDAQVPEAHVVRVVIVGKREGVIAIEPSVLGMAAVEALA